MNLFVFSFLTMNNRFIHAAKRFIFVLFQDLTWEIIVALFLVVVMQMQTVFSPLVVSLLNGALLNFHNFQTFLGPVPSPSGPYQGMKIIYH